MLPRRPRKAGSLLAYLRMILATFSRSADDVIPSNPMNGVERPKVRRNRWRILQPAEVRVVSKAFSDARARRGVPHVHADRAARQPATCAQVGARQPRRVNAAGGRVKVGGRGEADCASRRTRRRTHPAVPVDAVPVRQRLRVPPPEKRLAVVRRLVPRTARRGACEAGITDRVRLQDLRHAALTNLAATGASPIAVMATAGHRSMQTTKQYLHLAGVVFRDDADALSKRLLGVPESGTKQAETASLSGSG